MLNEVSLHIHKYSACILHFVTCKVHKINIIKKLKAINNRSYELLYRSEQMK